MAATGAMILNVLTCEFKFSSPIFWVVCFFLLSFLSFLHPVVVKCTTALALLYAGTAIWIVQVAEDCSS